ncbi:hypothetical protein [[Mycoplasma] anseris]|uniref:Uncharacterized protein n=1 Tax=[Mycoplasma] anseris TaxID=92400 RepID=A0A2Z4NCZ1_9BACT|nr:hypothetical protein [[Mycoplasma] anseris]AWX69441.1 hypothetical protein DP065_01570 [[Mycoplasma] anseris]
MNFNFLLNPTTTASVLKLISKENKKAKISFIFHIFLQIIMYSSILFCLIYFDYYYTTWIKEEDNKPLIRFIGVSLCFIIYPIYLLFAYTIFKPIIKNYFLSIDTNNKNYLKLDILLNKKNVYFFKTHLLIWIAIVLFISISALHQIFLFQQNPHINELEMFYFPYLIIMCVLKTIITNSFNLVRFYKKIPYKTDIDIQIRNNRIEFFTFWLYFLLGALIIRIGELSHSNDISIFPAYVVIAICVVACLIPLAIMFKWLIKYLSLRKENVNKKTKDLMIFLPIVF